MEKSGLSIFEALGIVLKRKEKLFFIACILFLCGVIMLLGIGAIAICEYAHESKMWLFVGWGLGCLAFSYLMVTFLLKSSFQTNRFLDALLKDTLHELNIPLSVIKANLQMLRTHENDEKKQKRLERIALASDDLYGLYQEVDYYIKKERKADVKEAFFLDEAVCSVIQNYEDIAASTFIFYEVLHVKILADKRGFMKGVSNLINNAIKYNRDHNPIMILQRGNALVVKDEGIGIGEAELFLIFNRYFQADVTQVGYGIGLSLVKAYCDHFKIPLSINSAKDKGTEVILDLSNLLIKT